MLLLLLALGGGKPGSPAAAVPAEATSDATSDAVAGVWRGAWAPSTAEDTVPVEAIVTGPAKDGQLIALLASGTGRTRRTARLTGHLEADGARFTLPGGGSLRLAAGSASRLVGIVKGAGAQSPLPGDGTLELARVRR